ncbi:metallophosphoesterase [Methanonatronarchaeum sp. AMET-Sl]|uniref:metallophosphoesterase n=1 Tax=Methanonatronarchaeum sp. AMET-Sl TaxID=3037654 RepID=UPI00244DF239|nr:metallophosphoesterase [Methanonatronarchaeum sp. AMET-Sl]WGI16899.1 metallophosphoesterase [Methanonatronarchaeum sp. AMET-Sl]
MASINPVPGEPAALINDILVIADLHLGVETSYRERGVMIPSQTNKNLKRITKLIKKLEPNRLLILGDFKHNVKGSSWQEKDEIPPLLDKLSDLLPISIVPGNHDGNLKSLLPRDKDIKLHSNRGTVIEDIGLVHGHTWPKPEIINSPKILTGHNHPVIQFNDNLGREQRKKAWIRAPLNKKTTLNRYPEIDWKNQEIIIQPAYSNLVGSAVFNKQNKFLGPLFNQKLINPKKMKAHLLDGTYIGQLTPQPKKDKP